MAQTQPIAQQPVVSQEQPVESAGQIQQVEERTSIWKKWWLWLIIAVVIGAGIYFLFFF